MASLADDMAGMRARARLDDIWLEGYAGAKDDVRKIVTSGSVSEVIDRLQAWLDED